MPTDFLPVLTVGPFRMSLRKGMGTCLLMALVLAGCTSPNSEHDNAAQTPDAPATVTGRPQTTERVEAPDGMVYVPGGRTRIGVERTTLQAIAAGRPPGPRHMWGRESMPAFTAQVEPFFLDVHPVTVAQFRRFVDATEYETEAERFGNGGVFDLQAQRWRLVDGADWQRPRGPDAPSAPNDHPVTQVSWNDADRYCTWAGKRLPTEVEWEHAARGATNRRSYCPWDGACDPATRATKANTWQGHFPARNTATDGYRFTSPVGAFGKDSLGLTDMAGNVWEWTASWFRPYPLSASSSPPTNRSEKVQRGGSFLCNECGGFHVFSRSHSTPETSLFQVGFRCAKNVPDQRPDVP